MQPDPLDHENSQVDPIQQEEKPNEISPLEVPATAKKKPANWAIIFICLFLFLLLTLTVGVGLWAYKLNSSLTAKQQEVNKLQTDYDKLRKDYEQQSLELDSVKQELETVQADLEEITSDNEELNTKLEKAGKYADLLNSLFSTSTIKTQDKVQAINDSDLTRLYDIYNEANEEEKILAWLVIIKHIAEEISSITR